MKDTTAATVAVSKKKKKTSVIGDFAEKVASRAQKEFQKVVRESVSQVRDQVVALVYSAVSSSISVAAATSSVAASSAATLAAASGTTATLVAQSLIVAAATTTAAISVGVVEVTPEDVGNVLGEMGLEGVVDTDTITAMTEALNQLSPEAKAAAKQLSDEIKEGTADIADINSFILLTAQTEAESTINTLTATASTDTSNTNNLDINEFVTNNEADPIVHYNGIIGPDSVDENTPTTLQVSFYDSEVGRVLVPLEVPALDHEAGSVYVATVSYTSPISGLTHTEQVSIFVADVNEQGAFDTSGTFEVDENANDTITVPFNDPEQGLIYVQAQVSAQDYEANDRVIVPVTFTDAGGIATATEVIVNIRDVNELPSFMYASVTQIQENKAGIVTVTWSDPEQGVITTTHSVPPQNFEESGASILFPVEFTDEGGLSAATEIPVTITDVNEAPFDLTTSVSVDAGNFVLTLSAQDPDSGDTLTFFQDGVALSDNTITLTPEQVANGPDLITLSAVDSGGLTVALDVRPPQVVDEPGNDVPQFLDQSITSMDENNGATLVLTWYDPEDGVISTTHEIPAQDFEEGTVYEAEVFVTDSEGAENSTTIQVEVRNINEQAVFQSVDVQSIPENQEQVITATFLDPEDGIITLQQTVPAQDFENNETIGLTFQLTDSGGLQSESIDITVGITDVNEDPIATLITDTTLVYNTNNTVTVQWDDPEQGIINIDYVVVPTGLNSTNTFVAEFTDSQNNTHTQTFTFDVDFFGPNRIVNGDFSQGLTGWVGNADVRTSSRFPDNGNVIDFDNGSRGDITQTIDGLEAGKQYLLQFDYASFRGDSTNLRIHWNGEGPTDFNNIDLSSFDVFTHDDFETFSALVTAEEFNSLRIFTTTTSKTSPILDNVRLTEVPPLELITPQGLTLGIDETQTIDFSDPLNAHSFERFGVVGTFYDPVEQGLDIRNDNSAPLEGGYRGAIGIRITLEEATDGLSILTQINLDDRDRDGTDRISLILHEYPTTENPLDNGDFILDYTSERLVNGVPNTIEHTFNTQLEAGEYLLLIDQDESGQDNTDWQIDSLTVSSDVIGLS